MSTTKSRPQLVKELQTLVCTSGNLHALFLNALAARAGLSAMELECCNVLQDSGPMTAGELSRRCGITTGGMTGMLDRLERMGLATRAHDPADRRRVLVSFHHEKASSASWAIALFAPLQKAFDDLVASYSDDQLAFLLNHFQQTAEMLRRVTDHIQHGHVTPAHTER